MQIQDKQLEGKVGLVKCTEDAPVMLYSNRSMCLSGIIQDLKLGTRQRVIFQNSPDSLIPAEIEVTPTILELYPGEEGKEVVVRLSNLSLSPVKIYPHSILGELHVVDLVRKTTVNSILPSSTTESTTTDTFLDKIDFATSALNPDQLHTFKDFLNQWSPIFSHSDRDIGSISLVKHKIQLSDEIPFKQPHRRIPPGMYEEVKEHLHDLIEAGIIRRSHSPYVSPVVLARKKDNSLRMCVDYRMLNKKTIRDAYALPRIEEMLDNLAGSKYFSVVDMKSGYHQVSIEDSDIPKTAFTVGPLGFYEYVRLPFGLTNAPGTYQRLMQDCLGDLNWKICAIFIDDLIIFSRTYEEHIERLTQVFTKLREHGIKLAPKKCEFIQEKVRYLGHIVSEDGITTDPKKTDKVESWPVPTNVDELRKFLGFVGYYRRFIKDFSKTAKVLNDLLVGGPTVKKRGRAVKEKQKKEWKWEEAQKEAFQNLKTSLVQPPVLAYADFTQPFILHTDASGVGLGAVLYQKQDGFERVIAYASRSLTKAEKNYPAHKLEYLALKWAVTDKFHQYLFNNNFTVFTDNNPLTYILTTAKLDATGHRWLAALSNYNFSIKYRAGRKNMDADALSRMTENDYQEVSPDVMEAIRNSDTDEGYIQTVSMSHQVSPNMMTLTTPIVSLGEWERRQGEDPLLRQLCNDILNGRPARTKTGSPEEAALYRHYEHFVLKSGTLYRRTMVAGDEILQLVLPEAYRRLAIVGVHDDLGHQGRDRTIGLAQERFYWPKMTFQIEESSVCA
ncbi:retrovirus-related Pol polyprotein from transposon opus isoform X1 [Patella vulgata]|uniref:retrovirus-related Pol polyprotein from transposon opus isoform X1 n=1 Tax=Patella vulgata TaxID=6465 RepID=UPI0024A9A135|nr:retrovirus-related Pol polyprotein from transposon opus isoform X1 [Patella vulgata]